MICVYGNSAGFLEEVLEFWSLQNEEGARKAEQEHKHSGRGTPTRASYWEVRRGPPDPVAETDLPGASRATEPFFRVVSMFYALGIWDNYVQWFVVFLW